MTIASPFVLDLREEGRVGARKLGEMPELTPGEREAAIATWRGRMVNEHISSRVFAALLPQLMRAGIAAKWQAQVANAASEELDHGRRCASVVSALGGDPYAVIPHLEDVPQHEDATPMEAALRNLLSISCLSETVAVSLISAERSRAGVDTIERTLAEILADEVRHARTGWAIVEELAPSLQPALVDRLNRYLAVAFRHLLAHELAHLPEGPAPSQQAEAVGVCDGSEGRALFFDTVTTIIVPRLQALGFDAATAWQKAGGPARSESAQSDACGPAIAAVVH